VVPIPGARDAAQAEQNAQSVGWRMTAGEAKEIEQACRELELDYFLK